MMVSMSVLLRGQEGGLEGGTMKKGLCEGTGLLLRGAVVRPDEL